jgi:hypothetical protein
MARFPNDFGNQNTTKDREQHARDLIDAVEHA